MKEIKYTNLHSVFARNFLIPFYYVSVTVISYGSDFLKSYGSGSIPHGKKLRFRSHNNGDVARTAMDNIGLLERFQFFIFPVPLERME
jgi:hypothetical protein